METVEKTERKHIKWEPTSAKSFEDISKYIEIPKEVKGLNFLDIGAGGSDVTATLLEKGANAFAVDPLYKDISDLKERMNGFFERARKKGAKWVARQEKAFEKFYESIKTNPDNYKAGFAQELPFPDDFFDYVISVTSITQYLDSNEEALISSINEAIRVTKPDGLIQIFPFQDQYIPAVAPGSPGREAYDTFYEVRQKNQQKLLEKLEENPNVSLSVQSIEDEIGNHKLVIVKQS